MEALLSLLLPAAVPVLSLILTQAIKSAWKLVLPKIPPALIPVIAMGAGAAIDGIGGFSGGGAAVGALLGLAATGLHQIYALAAGKAYKK